MKVLVDVNVLLDVLLNRPPWVADSRAIWDAAHLGKIQGFVVATAVTNLFYLARKSVGSQLAIRGVAQCLTAFEVISVDHAVLSAALLLAGGDFEDNVAIQCAVSSGMDGVVTRDLTGFKHCAVPVFTPGQLVVHLSSQSP